MAKRKKNVTGMIDDKAKNVFTDITKVHTPPKMHIPVRSLSNVSRWFPMFQDRIGNI